jgi:hypothetical protein
MSARLLARRQRLVRVREAQHAMAVAETVRARDEADTIANNARRVSRVRAELFEVERTQMGGTFASYRELAERLERAGKQLEGALYDANRVIGQKQVRQVEASREEEIARRLKERIHARIEDEREARIAAIPRQRLPRQGQPGQSEDKT